ncbi:serine hydrolase domain-containing protein [Veronia nyctiphanis]|nr:serine hydrolase [Veronia nyctiphanis]
MTKIESVLLTVKFVFLGMMMAMTEQVEANEIGVVSQLANILEETQTFSPGAILHVNSPDFQFRQAVGVANKKQDLPMQSNFTLRVGSITKIYIAALSVMAEKEKRINVGDKAYQYVPEWALEHLPKNINPTIEQLLNHTSGIPDYYSVGFYLFDWNQEEPITPRLVLESISGKSASLSGKFEYSNTNYHVLALVLENVYRRSLASLLSEKIFEPMGLDDTYYGESSPTGDVIHGYGAYTMGWGASLMPWKDTYAWKENTGPDGGLLATASDVDVWLRALYSQDGQFSDIGVAMMKKPISDSERVKQGFGTEILFSRAGTKVVGHTGALDGYLTAAFYIPSKDTSFVFHVNKTDHSGFSSTLSSVIKILLADHNS